MFDKVSSKSSATAGLFLLLLFVLDINKCIYLTLILELLYVCFEFNQKLLEHFKFLPMKKCLLLVFMITGFSCYSQITGSVVAAVDAIVTISDEKGITDTKGEASFIFPSTETLSYKVEFEDYEAITGTYEVALGSSIDIEFTSVGINSGELFKMKVYPNPTNGSVYVAATDINSVSVYTIAGELLNAFSYNGVDKANIALNELEDGVYLISVQTSKGQRMERIVKQ